MPGWALKYTLTRDLFRPFVLLTLLEITRSRTSGYEYKIFSVFLSISPRYLKFCTQKSTQRILSVHPVAKKYDARAKKLVFVFVNLGFLYMNHWIFSKFCSFEVSRHRFGGLWEPLKPGLPSV